MKSTGKYVKVVLLDIHHIQRGPTKAVIVSMLLSVSMVIPLF